MSQIEIRRVELSDLAQDKQSLRVTFKYQGEPQEIKIECWDLIFQTVKVIAPNMGVQNNMVYWFEIYSDKGIDINKNYQVSSKFNEGVLLHFKNMDDEILETKEVPIGNYDLSYRNSNGLYSKPRIWMIGDSHIGVGFKDQIKENLCYEKFCFNPIAMPSLTLHRFTDRNFMNFFRTLPILEKDVIVISIGEIDLRKNILKNSKQKGFDNLYFIFSLFQNFLKLIDTLSEQYPTNKIYYEMPHAPFKDSWINDDLRDHFLADGVENERLKVWGVFKKLMVSENKKNPKFTLLDFNENFVNSQGFIDDKFMRENDSHLLDGKIYYNLLRKFFENECI